MRLLRWWVVQDDSAFGVNANALLSRFDRLESATNWLRIFYANNERINERL